MGPQPLPNNSVNKPEWAHRSDNVDILEWALNDHLIMLLIILNGPTEA